MTTQPAAHPEAANPPTASTTQQQKKREHFSTDLSRKEMETRRLQAAGAIETVLALKGSLADIARAYGVSRTTVTRWNKARLAGKSLQATKTPGRPHFLTSEQEQQLKIHCEKGITYEGLREQLKVFGVKVCKDHLVRLRKRLGIPLIFAKRGRKRERP